MALQGRLSARIAWLLTGLAVGNLVEVESAQHLWNSQKTIYKTSYATQVTARPSIYPNRISSANCPIRIANHLWDALARQTETHPPVFRRPRYPPKATSWCPSWRLTGAPSTPASSAPPTASGAASPSTERLPSLSVVTVSYEFQLHMLDFKL